MNIISAAFRFSFSFFDFQHIHPMVQIIIIIIVWIMSFPLDMNTVCNYVESTLQFYGKWNTHYTVVQGTYTHTHTLTLTRARRMHIGRALTIRIYVRLIFCSNMISLSLVISAHNSSRTTSCGVDSTTELQNEFYISISISNSIVPTMP